MARWRIEPHILLQEGAGGARDGGQRRTQIVGDGAEQGTPQPLGLNLDLGLLGFLGEQSPLERQGGLAGEGFEQSDLLWGK